MGNLFNSTNAMLDIETIGTAVDSAVWEVGLCLFNWRSDMTISPATVKVWHLQTATQVGRTSSQDTLRWMAEVPTRWDRFQKSQQNGFGLTVSKDRLFEEMHRMLDSQTYIWCKGGSFDFAILKHLFGGKTPWHHQKEMCMRSTLAMAAADGYEVPQGLRLHDAASDINDQLIALEGAIQRVRRAPKMDPANMPAPFFKSTQRPTT